MKRVTGVGGIFFKSENPEALYRWYETHLGIKGDPPNSPHSLGVMPKIARRRMTVWSLFPKHPSQSALMVNCIVDDLDALLKALQEGVAIEKREDYEYGRFAWIMDPEGNRIEPWEPPK